MEQAHKYLIKNISQTRNFSVFDKKPLYILTVFFEENVRCPAGTRFLWF